MEGNFYHNPVMINEVESYLIRQDSGYYIDCTFGGGGHSIYLLEKYKNIKIIAFDQDEDSFSRFKNNDRAVKVKDRIVFCKRNFRHVAEVLEEYNIGKVNGLLADLGVSSKQLDDMSRGFSFNSDSLDMRMDNTNPLTASDIVNTFDRDRLADIFFKYGEESFAKQIAAKIVESRIKSPVKSGCELRDIVCKVKWAKGKINPSTKIFQALRIYVNDELGSLEEMLNSVPDILSSGSRAVILTYHSLEDRIVKNCFKMFAHENLVTIINKKVITASEEEINQNPRSRSAKMRVAETKSV